MSGLEGALCRGKSKLFDSTHPSDHEAARELCAVCPALVACAINLREVQLATAGTRDAGGGPSGTWAGKLMGVKGREIQRRGLPREHGTQRGYDQHRHVHEKPCPACLAAHYEVLNERFGVAQ